MSEIERQRLYTDEEKRLRNLQQSKDYYYRVRRNKILKDPLENKNLMKQKKKSFIRDLESFISLNLTEIDFEALTGHLDDMKAIISNCKRN
jgi:hypothetical protein